MSVHPSAELDPMQAPRRVASAVARQEEGPRLASLRDRDAHANDVPAQLRNALVEEARTQPFDHTNSREHASAVARPWNPDPARATEQEISAWTRTHCARSSAAATESGAAAAEDRLGNNEANENARVPDHDCTPDLPNCDGTSARTECGWVASDVGCPMNAGSMDRTGIGAETCTGGFGGLRARPVIVENATQRHGSYVLEDVLGARRERYRSCFSAMLRASDGSWDKVGDVSKKKSEPRPSDLDFAKIVVRRRQYPILGFGRVDGTVGGDVVEEEDDDGEGRRGWGRCKREWREGTDI